MLKRTVKITKNIKCHDLEVLRNKTWRQMLKSHRLEANIAARWVKLLLVNLASQMGTLVPILATQFPIHLLS